MNVQRLREFLAVLPDEVDVSVDEFENNVLRLSLDQQISLLDLEEYDNNACNAHFIFEGERVVGFAFPPPRTNNEHPDPRPFTEEQRMEWERLANEYRDLAQPVQLSREEALQAVEQPFYAVSLLVKPEQ
jgi:hypothetical protein